MRTVLIASTCACGLAACLFPSLDALTDGGSKDATSEPAPIDATPDATPTWCASQTARFCEDFDDSDASKFAKWPNETQQDGVTVARGVSDASAPFAARFVQIGLDAGAPFGALEHDFTSPPITSSAHLAFDVRVDSFPAFGDLKPVATIQFDATLWPNVDDCVALALQPSSAAIFECVPTDAGGSIYPGHALAQTAPLGKWMHVDMSLIFAPGNISLTVQFDGVTVLPPTKLDSRITYAAPALQIGLVAMDPRSSASMLIDDVTLDWQ